MTITANYYDENDCCYRFKITDYEIDWHSTQWPCRLEYNGVRIDGVEIIDSEIELTDEQTEAMENRIIDWLNAGNVDDEMAAEIQVHDAEHKAGYFN